MDDPLIEEQKAYYRARAPEYDRWFTRTGRYDAVFFGFWLSHVPPERFAAFWALVRAALAPGGRVFFVDSLAPETERDADRHATPADPVAVRRLDDGREFRIVKVFYAPAELEARLAELGWQVEVRATATHFLYGRGAPR
jgi:demethylmenaquinone methyltransferase/2-methoxy-6-polyprenyl-1,4-benzoquinol methylase